MEAECKEAEGKVERLRRQNELILNSAGEGIFGLDREGRHTFVNPSAARMLGYEVEELIGQHSHSIWHHSKADSSPYPEEDCPIYEAYKDGAVHHVRDEVFWKKDGTSFSVAYTSTPIMEKGNIIGAVVTFRDITERKRSAEMLAKALNEQKNIMDTIPDIIYVLDMGGNLAKWNKSVEIITGFSAEELKGKYVLDFFPEQDRISIAGAIKQAFEKGYAQTKGHLLKKDGTLVPYEWNGAPLNDQQGKVIGLIGVGRDITKRKQAEEVLQASEHRYRTLVENLPQKIFLKGKILVYISCNENYARDLKIKADEIAGKTDFDFFPKELAEKYRADDKRIMESGDTEDIEERYIQNGRETWVYTVKVPTKDEKGNSIGVLGIFWDITERKRAEEQIKKLNEELEQRVIERTAQLEAANKGLESFSYSVSHDLRAPVRAISGFSSMLLNDYSDKLDDEGKRLLNVIRNSAQKMAELIDDLLALSRIGRKDIELSVVEMNTTIASVLDEIKTTMPERNLQFSIKPLPMARCDAGMIRLVLLNLLYNAVKFTKQRENVIIEIGGRDGKGENVYYVKDNGVGFDMQYASKLFGAFQRLHSGEEFEGTGIGLAIVQRIIYRHGGRVWAEGKVNEGATFYFTLPREPELFLTKSES